MNEVGDNIDLGEDNDDDIDISEDTDEENKNRKILENPENRAVLRAGTSGLGGHG